MKPWRRCLDRVMIGLRLRFRQNLEPATAAVRGYPRMTPRTKGCEVRTTVTSVQRLANVGWRWSIAGTVPYGWMTGTGMVDQLGYGDDGDCAMVGQGGMQTRPPDWTRCLAKIVQVSKKAVVDLLVLAAANTRS